MFTEALQKELYQVRAYKLHELQKAGKSLALLPHMIMVREAEGMPYDGATALYRAACEGNVELVSWLLEHGADTRLTDKHGNVVTELKNIPNEEAIRNLINWYKE
jgi:ankyrin repeat protein